MRPDQRINHILLRILFLFIFEFSSVFLSAQVHKEYYRIMFYNLENLFDIYDDPLTNDDEFTPDGEKTWTNYRYQKKINDLSKVIIALGEWNPPSVIGLCEIENFQVLLDLTTKTPLAGLGYQIIHENSNDERGIDVALLYRPNEVQRLAYKTLPVKSNSFFKTRDILLAKLAFDQSDTIHIFVNHWPSRFGGKENTENKRIDAAQTLRNHVDSLQRIVNHPKILIMGDFNDEPGDKSIVEVLDASPIKGEIEKNQLYNLSYSDFKNNMGTIVYREINNAWYLFDQIIVSGSLMNNNGMVIKGKKSMIFQAPWILRNDKPYRTYQGPVYLGGYSDHLPIFIDLHSKQ